MTPTSASGSGGPQDGTSTATSSTPRAAEGSVPLQGRDSDRSGADDQAPPSGPPPGDAPPRSHVNGFQSQWMNEPERVGTGLVQVVGNFLSKVTSSNGAAARFVGVALGTCLAVGVLVLAAAFAYKVLGWKAGGGFAGAAKSPWSLLGLGSVTSLGVTWGAKKVNHKLHQRAARKNRSRRSPADKTDDSGTESAAPQGISRADEPEHH